MNVADAASVATLFVTPRMQASRASKKERNAFVIKF